MTSHTAVRSFLFSLAVAVSAHAQELTEREVIRRYLSGSSARIAALEVQVTRAEWQGRTALPNPSASFTREDAAGTRDQFLTFSQRLPITGRRSALKEAGTAAVREDEFLVARRRQATVAELRRLFHRAAAWQTRHSALIASQAQVREIVRVLKEREQAGESSGFDRMRTEREADSIATRLAAERSEYLAAIRDLETILGESIIDVRLVAEPSAAPPFSQADVEDLAVSARPDYLAKKQQIERFRAERRAAARTAIPEPTLIGGSKTTRSPGFNDTGYVAAVSIDLPLFNRGKADTARFKAEAERAELELKLLENRIRAETKAASERLNAQQALATSLAPDEDLGRIAQLSYDEGEASIVELLDAYRVTLEARLRTADIRLTLAEAQIDFDLATGKEVQP